MNDAIETELGAIEDAMTRAEEISFHLSGGLRGQVRLEFRTGMWRAIEMGQNGWTNRSPPFHRPMAAVSWLVKRLESAAERADAENDACDAHFAALRKVAP